MNELLLDGNTFKDSTVFTGSNFLNLKLIKQITLKNNQFFNITYQSSGISSNLIMIPKATLNKLIIDGTSYENSQLNFLYLEGLSPVNETFSSIEINNLKIKNLEFDRNSLLITTGDFLSELKIQTSMRNSEFKNI